MIFLWPWVTKLLSVLGWIVFCKNSCLPRIWICDHIGKQGLCRYYQVKMKSCWIKIGPKSNTTGVFIRRGKFGHRHGHSWEKTMWRWKQRWEFRIYKPRNATGCRQSPEAKEKNGDRLNLSSESSEGTNHTDTLIWTSSL